MVCCFTMPQPLTWEKGGGGSKIVLLSTCFIHCCIELFVFLITANRCFVDKSFMFAPVLIIHR